MSCQRRHSFNYRFISVMFWAFPYLLWQAFGNISGFFVGVMLALTLTIMFQALLNRTHEQRISVRRRSFQVQTTTTLAHSQEKAIQPYQDGYQGEEKNSSLSAPVPYQPAQLQPQYEEMQVPYPQEMPPMKQEQR